MDGLVKIVHAKVTTDVWELYDMSMMVFVSFVVERLEADDNKILAAQSLEEDFNEPLNTGETLSQVVPKFI